MGLFPVADTPLPRAASVSLASAAVLLATGLTVWAQHAPLRQPLVERRLPGLSIAMPPWSVASCQTDRYERGEYKLDSPDGYGRFISLRWETGDVPEEILDRAWLAARLTPSVKEPVTVAGHPGTRQFLFSGTKSVWVTTWRCPEDQRWFCLTTFLDLSREKLLALHESMLSSVRCHTEGRRAPAPPLYATFSPPPGWKAAPKRVADAAFAGPHGELVVMSQATAGRHTFLDAADDEEIRGIAKALWSLQTVDRAQRQTMLDGHGHTRIVWSCSGKTAKGLTLQLEWMAWYCPVRDATFMVCYLTPDAHDASVATEVLLRAECH